MSVRNGITDGTACGKCYTAWPKSWSPHIGQSQSTPRDLPLVFNKLLRVGCLIFLSDFEGYIRRNHYVFNKVYWEAMKNKKNSTYWPLMWGRNTKVMQNFRSLKINQMVAQYLYNVYTQTILFSSILGRVCDAREEGTRDKNDGRS